jgi:hypothetical protein
MTLSVMRCRFDVYECCICYALRIDAAAVLHTLQSHGTIGSTLAPSITDAQTMKSIFTTCALYDIDIYTAVLSAMHTTLTHYMHRSAIATRVLKYYAPLFYQFQCCTVWHLLLSTHICAAAQTAANATLTLTYAVSALQLSAHYAVHNKSVELGCCP